MNGDDPMGLSPWGGYRISDVDPDRGDVGHVRCQTPIVS